MASDGSSRSALLTAGGVLSIVAGALEVILGGLAAVALAILRVLFRVAPLPFNLDPRFGHAVGLVPFWSVIVGVPLFALGIVAVIGGVYAIRRRVFGLALAGAICGLIPLNPLGLLAVIFIAVSKREFRAKE
jgi:hypothetical protein